MNDSLLSLLAGGWGRFGDWFVSATSISPWLVTLGVVAACLAYRISAIASHDRRELKRRKELIDQSRRFVDAAIGSNLSYLDALERHRARAHGLLGLASLNVEVLADAPGIGPQTIEGLRQRGMFTLGDLSEPRRIADIWGIGPVRLGAIRRHVAALTAQMEEALRQWSPGEPLPFSRYPEVDEAFDRHRSQVMDRLGELETDLGQFVEFSADVAAFEEATREQDGASRWRSVLADWRAAIARPGRLASRAILLFTGLALCAALPFVAVLWDSQWASFAAIASVVVSWLGFHAALLAYFILADRPRGWRLRVPDPGVFEHQRLQFLALQMSAELGIAPPRLMIADGAGPMTMNAFACGRPSGPSVVCIGRMLLERMDEAEVRAVLGHELGHLKHDDSRRDEAFRLLTTPVGTVTDVLAGAAAFLSLRARYRLLYEREGTYLLPRFGLPTLFYGALWVPVAMTAAVAIAVRMGFETVKGVSSRLDEYEADRVGAALAGGPDYMASALARLEEICSISSEGEAALQEIRGPMPGAPTVRAFIPARMRAELWLQGLMHNFGASHPPHPARLDALENDIPVIRDIVGSVARLVLVLGVLATFLWGTVEAARAGLDWGAEQAGRATEWWADREVAAADEAPSENAEESAKPAVSGTQTLMITSQRGCNLRRAPTRKSKSLRVMRRGTQCESLGAAEGRWLPAKCGDQQGYVHRVCLR